MQSQVVVTSYIPPAAAKPAEGGTTELAGLLTQILDVQRLQLNQLKANAAHQDAGARWRALMAKWREEFPTLGDNCKHALPILERAFGAMIAQMTEELRDQGADALDNDFAVQDFLDRYGMRLGQMGNLLSVVGPLAEIGSQNESS